MKKLWHFISFLGLEDRTKNLKQRTSILANQLNFVILSISFFFLIFLKIMSFLMESPMEMGSLRVLFLFILNVIILVLAVLKLHKLGKYILIFLPPILILVIPTLTGFVEEESFVYYPFLIIGFSTVPQLLLLPDKHKYLFHFSLFYYLFLLLFIDRLLVLFTPVQYVIMERMEQFYVFNKAVQICLFFFISLSLFYVRRLNILFEKDIRLKNKELDKQNEELKSAMDQLKRAQQQLIQSEKMASIGSLTAGIAHEINNPLNYISGGLEIMQDTIVEDELLKKSDAFTKLSQPLHMIREGLTKSSRIVTALSSFSVPDESRLLAVNVHDIIDNTLLFLNIRISEQVSIVKEYLLLKPVPVFADKLHQILIAVFDNALNAIYSKNDLKDEKISIKTYSSFLAEREYAQIEITNTGPIIPESDIHKIFDPFFTTKSPGRGPGLGLTIAYAMVHEHGGEIICENLETGPRFTITIPI